MAWSIRAGGEGGISNSGCTFLAGILQPGLPVTLKMTGQIASLDPGPPSCATGTEFPAMKQILRPKQSMGLYLPRGHESPITDDGRDKPLPRGSHHGIGKPRCRKPESPIVSATAEEAAPLLAPTPPDGAGEDEL